MEFDFNKFMKLCCRNTNGFLDLRDENNRNEFMRCVNEYNIECSGYVGIGAPFVWFDDIGKEIVRGADDCWDYRMKIYPFEDFLQDPTLKIKDVLDFLGV